jgi:hypothetical protein
LLEFLTTQAVMSFQVPAESVMPTVAMGRMVMVNYMPWKRRDPPIPLLALLPLDVGALLAHNGAVREFMVRGSGARLGPAIVRVLRAGVGVLTRSEAFFYYTKMVSLATGAYLQRYDTSHVLERGGVAYAQSVERG